VTDDTPKVQTARAPEHRLRGIALMCVANLCFSSIDAIAKFLIHDMSSLQVTWARFAGAFVVALFLSGVLVKPGVLGTQRPYAHIFRATLVVIANVPMVFALRYLQLDQTSSIMFTTPFLVAALAVPLLGERIGPRRWAAICVGFVGVLLVIRPGLGGIHPAAGLCFISALAYAFYSIMTRILSHTESGPTMLFYTNVSGMVLMSLVVPFVWTMPSANEALLMFGMGVMACFGHYLLIAAHRMTPASVLAPFMYTQLIWMIFYGYTLFADLPNHWTLAGASVVIASGLYLLYRERQVKGPAAPVSGDPIA
jgi:drug/metabolite transporter (DMT)-like permease